MDCVKGGSDLVESPRRKPSKTKKVKEGGVAKTKPRTGHIDRSARAAEFALFVEVFRQELDPQSPIERLLADHVIQAAWQLKSILDRQASRGMGTAIGSDGPKKPAVSQADLAAKSLRDALESFDCVRARRTPVTPLKAPMGGESDSNEWPIVPTDGLDDFLDDPESVEEETPDWRDRLVFDFEVSDISPVVKGTWITVSHVVSLIVDGWTWADILRSHPELSEDDIRTCVSYAMAEENSVD